jgi:hypothetical protein
MYPAAAIVLAAVLDKSLSMVAGHSRKKDQSPYSGLSETGPTIESDATAVWKWIFLFLSVLLPVFAALIFLILRSFMPHLAAMLHYIPPLVIAGAGLFIAGCVFRRKMSYCFPTVAAAMWLTFMVGVVYYFPALEAYRPVKSFCRQIEANATGDFEAGYYGVTVPSMVFYLQKQIFQEYNAASMLSRFQSDDPVFCILTARDHAFFTENFGLHLPVLDRSPRFSINLKSILNSGYAPGDALLLVSNRPVEHNR